MMSRALAIAVAVAAAVGAASCVSSNVSRSLGARCDSSAECDDRCLPDSDNYPGGFCTIVCDSSADCPSGASCMDREGGACLFDCTSDADCAFLGVGWNCREDGSRPDPRVKVSTCRGD